TSMSHIRYAKVAAAREMIRNGAGTDFDMGIVEPVVRDAIAAPVPPTVAEQERWDRDNDGDRFE
ncbi:hypothetical protein Q8G39_28325, partial [Klebsiella pneumoniae]|uniref:hypothetical protein n=1 Tax=Klebsiella pneumoniae TaxID=573 RepID=UPI003013D30F